MPLIVGHRGAAGLAPENTLEGFELAIQLGVDMIETDVRVSKDGQAVIVHDDRFSNEEKRRLKVLDATMPQLKSHNPSIVTLEETIDFISKRVCLMIEVKDRVDTKPVVTIVQSFLDKGWQPADFMFASFDFKVLQALKAALPDIELVVLDGFSSVRAVLRARRLGTRYLSMDQSYLWWGVVRNLAKDYKLFTYPDQHIPLLKTNPLRPFGWVKYGLHGIITDYPDKIG